MSPCATVQHQLPIAAQNNNGAVESQLAWEGFTAKSLCPSVHEVCDFDSSPSHRGKLACWEAQLMAVTFPGTTGSGMLVAEIAKRDANKQTYRETDSTMTRTAESAGKRIGRPIQFVCGLSMTSVPWCSRCRNTHIRDRRRAKFS